MTATSDPSTTAEVVQYLAHDLRQPLSSLENIAYHLEMVLTDQDPKVRHQFETMRRLIDQANWILEDAVCALQTLGARREPDDLKHFIEEFAADQIMHEDRELRLEIPPNIPLVSIDRSLLTRLLESSLNCLRAAGGSHEKVTLAAAVSDGFAWLSLAEVVAPSQVANFAAMVGPRRQRAGSLRLLAEAQGGALRFTASDGTLRIEFSLPLA